MMPNRIAFVDIAKCLGIFLVILGHTGGGYLHDWIYSFHMPFFFFISGLFIDESKYTSLRKVLSKNFRQLIVPYIFFYIITIPFGLVHIHITKDIPVSCGYIWKPILGMIYGVDTFNSICYFTNDPLWFLLALFIARIIFYINRLHNFSNFGILLIAIFGLALTHILKYIHLNIWSIAQCLLLYPYMCIGYILNCKYRILSRINVSSRIKAFVVLFILLVIVSICSYYMVIDYNALQLGAYPLISLAIGLGGSYMLLVAGKLISQYGCKYLLKIGGVQ